MGRHTVSHISPHCMSSTLIDSWLSFWIWVWEEKSGICARASNRAEPETIPHCSDGKSGKADEKWHTENKRKNINKESIPGESEMSGAEDAALPGGWRRISASMGASRSLLGFIHLMSLLWKRLEERWHGKESAGQTQALHYCVCGSYVLVLVHLVAWQRKSSSLFFSPRSEKILSLIPGLSVWSLHALPVFVWVLSTRLQQMWVL